MGLGVGKNGGEHGTYKILVFRKSLGTSKVLNTNMFINKERKSRIRYRDRL